MKRYTDWALLACGVIAIILYVLLMLWQAPVAYGQENSGCHECNEVRWFLRYQGHTIGTEDMESEEECEALKAEIDLQTPGFTELKCVAVWVIRHDS